MGLKYAPENESLVVDIKTKYHKMNNNLCNEYFNTSLKIARISNELVPKTFYVKDFLKNLTVIFSSIIVPGL